MVGNLGSMEAEKAERRAGLVINMDLILGQNNPKALKDQRNENGKELTNTKWKLHAIIINRSTSLIQLNKPWI